MASKFHELIDRLCPGGVEYRKLGEIATVERGNGLQKSDFRPAGRPCIHYGQLYTKFNTVAESTLTFVDEATAAGLKSLNTGDLLMAVTSENVEDVCKCIAWLGADGVVVGGHTAIIRHTQDAKYLAYWFQTQDFFVQKKRLAHGTKVIEVTPKNLLDVLIPVPPLEIQREIVQILDNFAELTAELTAELEKRKKQYEYYRRSLLGGVERGTLNVERWPTVKLGDVCDCLDGKRIPLSSAQRRDRKGEYRYFGAQGVIDYIDDYIFDGCYLLVAEDGENLRSRKLPIAQMVEGRYWVNNHAHVLSETPKAALRYICYFLNSLDLTLYVTGAAQPKLNQANLNAIEIPLPPLAEQKRIVGILDRFDRLCNDLTAGLPAEIAARRKQYEYYRDKLLSFPPSPRGCGVAGNRKGMA